MANQTTNIKMMPNALKVKIAERQPIVLTASEPNLFQLQLLKSQEQCARTRENLNLSAGSRVAASFKGNKCNNTTPCSNLPVAATV